MIEDTIRQIIREEIAALKPQAKDDDRLLSAEQAAELLQVTPTFVYTHAKDYPFTVYLTNGEKKTIRFSHNRLQKWIEVQLKMQEKQPRVTAEDFKALEDIAQDSASIQARIRERRLKMQEGR